MDEGPTRGAPGAPASLARRLLSRGALVQPGEGRAVCWAAVFFFALLFSGSLLRPLRDSFGIEGGSENLPWLFTGTFAGTLVASPLFSILVSRYPRRVFLPFVYRFAAANLVGFLLLLVLLPAQARVGVGRVFFVWLSVFNLFGVSVLGGFLADLFTLEQGKRLFALIGVGGTLGALGGAWAAGRISRSASPEDLPLVLFGLSVALLELAARCVHVLRRVAPPRQLESHEPPPEAVLGGDMLQGIRSVLRSPFLLWICAYLFLQTWSATALYLQQAQIVERAFPDRILDRGARTEFLADVWFWTQALTVAVQLFFSGRILRRVGLGWVLAGLPLITLVGFVGVGLAPTLATIAVAQVLHRGMNFATAKPAREALYTLVSRQERYKSKSFIDTFVYRGGDAVSAWNVRLLGLSVAGLAWAAVPMAALWGLAGLALGRKSDVLRRERGSSGAPGTEVASPPVGARPGPG